MARYRWYKSSTGDVVRVKLGFSWRAFFIGSLTAIVRRTWLMATVGVLFFVTLVYASGSPSVNSRAVAFALAMAVFYLAYMVFCGIHASQWLDASLRRRGYVLTDESAGRSRSAKSAMEKPAADGGRVPS
ncbi:MAG: hypothetical protein ABIO71_11115 [Caldimonas sp.]